MYKFFLQERGATSRIAKRRLNDVNRTAAAQTGIYWKENYAEKHFTNAGASEYGYAPRQGESGNPFRFGFQRSYTGRKLRRMGHTRPLEYTGESKDRILNNPPNIRATASRGNAAVRVILNAPNLNWRNKNSRIDKRDEMTRVSHREGISLAQIFAENQQKNFDAINEQTTTRIG